MPEYQPPTSSQALEPSQRQSGTEVLSAHEPAQAQPHIYDIVEDKAERMLQLRLLHIYYHTIATPFAVPQRPEIEATWQIDVPEIAFQHNNLLYAIFAVAATWLLRSQPTNADLQIRRDRYLALSLQEQRREIDELRDPNIDGVSCDAVAFASLLIQMNAFAMLHERVRPVAGGYEPVIEWLKTGTGAGQVFSMVGETAKTNPEAKFLVLLNAPPAFPTHNVDYSFRFDAPSQSRGLLEGSLAMKESPTPATREVYQRTMRYLGALNHFIVEGQPGYTAARVIQGFAMLIPKDFTQYVQERRPVALAILAHFFALAAQVQDGPAWLGDAPRWAIEALSQTLHASFDQVLEEMKWPCEIASRR